MAHFAKVVDGVVEQVIVIDQETLNTGHWGDPALWKKCSYNTQGGVHLQGGTPVAKNYPGRGYLYDGIGFYAPSPYPSWTKNAETYLWEPPTPMPTEGGPWHWVEPTGWEVVEV